LDKLDVAFYADPDLLAERCKAYALKHQLYADGSYLDDAKPASMKNTGVDQAGRDDAGDG
jgi:hypothetical protein